MCLRVINVEETGVIFVLVSATCVDAAIVCQKWIIRDVPRLIDHLALILHYLFVLLLLFEHIKTVEHESCLLSLLLQSRHIKTLNSHTRILKHIQYRLF